MGTRLPTLTLSGEYLQPDIANRRGIDASVLQRQNQLVVFINGDIEFVALSVETRQIIVRPQHLTCAFHAASLTFGIEDDGINAHGIGLTQLSRRSEQRRLGNDGRSRVST